MRGGESNRIRDMVAAHELGHALAWKRAGLAIVSISVRGEERVRGWTELDGGEIESRDQMRDYLVGLLAGEFAGARWCDENRIPLRAQRCEFDESHFRRNMRDPLAQGLAAAGLRAAARAVVARSWPQICRLAPLLSSRGTLRV